jgi:hypothetical protein
MSEPKKKSRASYNLERRGFVLVDVSLQRGEFSVQTRGGVPLSTHRLQRSDEQFLVDAVAARIPIWEERHWFDLCCPQYRCNSRLRSAFRLGRLTQLINVGGPSSGADQTLLVGVDAELLGRWSCKLRELGGLGVIDQLGHLGLALRLR